MESLSNIQAVTFDVGGTLIDPFPSVGHVYAEAAERHGMRGLDPQELTVRFVRAWESKGSFDYSRTAWEQLVARTFNGWIAPGERVHFFDELYERFGQPDVWRVHEDVLPTIETLIERGMELGLVSNWDERLRPLLRRLKLDRYFRVVVISHEIGFCKPSSVIFEEAAKKFACPASSVLHVGDGRSEDYDGARGAGLSALLLDRNGREARMTALRSLTEVARHLI